MVIAVSLLAVRQPRLANEALGCFVAARHARHRCPTIQQGLGTDPRRRPRSDACRAGCDRVVDDLVGSDGPRHAPEDAEKKRRVQHKPFYRPCFRTHVAHDGERAADHVHGDRRSSHPDEEPFVRKWSRLLCGFRMMLAPSIRSDAQARGSSRCPGTAGSTPSIHRLSVAEWTQDQRTARVRLRRAAG